MTSQSSSLRRLSLEDLKQNTYFMIIHTILLMLISTLPAIVFLNNYSHAAEYEAKYILDNAYTALCASTPFTFFVVCIIGTIIGIMSYSYLYSMRSVIFYHSMPHKRSTIYISKAVSGIVSIIIPLLFVFAVNAVICACSGFFASRGFKTFFEPYAVILLMYVFVYSISAFAAVFSSNFFAHCIVIGFIYLVYPLTAGLVAGFFGTYTQTFEITPFLFNNLKYLFPPSAMLNFILGTTSSVTLPFVIYTLAVSLIAITLGMFIYKKRKTESTNKFIAFDFCKTFLKYYITAVSGIGFALIFYSISYKSTISGIIGLVIGSLIVWCILSAIFEKSFKSMFTGMKSFALLAIVLCIAVVAPAKILEKCDKSFPQNASKISVSSQKLFYTNGKTFEFKDSKNVKAITKVLENAAKRGRDELGENFAISDISVSTPAYKFWGIKRNLILSDKETEEILSVISESDEYIDAVTEFSAPKDYIGFSDYKAKYSNCISFPDISDEEVIKKTDVSKNIDSVLNALKSDIKAHPYSETKDLESEFNISFNSFKYDASAHEDKYFYYSVPVKSCYTKTLDAMRKHGFLDESRCNIERMAIMNYDNDQSDYNSNYGVDNSELLKIVLNKQTYNGIGNRVTIRFYSQYGDVVETQDYNFDSLPEELQNFITKNKIKIAYSENEADFYNTTSAQDENGEIVTTVTSDLSIAQ